MSEEQDPQANSGADNGAETPKSQSPGERIAAQRAAKAARKAVERGKQAEMVEEKVIKQASEYGEWVKENQTPILIAVAAAVVIFLGYIGFDTFSESNSQDAAALLWVATETAEAPIRPETGAADDANAEAGADSEPEEEEESYVTIVDRAEAAITAYDAVLDQFAGTDAAMWARLGKGSALLQADRAEEARDEFSAVLQDTDDVNVTWRALEGLAFAFEAEERWEDARAQMEELESAGGGFVALVARYHLARLFVAEGSEDRATEAFRSLSEDLAAEPASAWPYLTLQVERRLNELDPEAAAASSAAAANPLAGLTGDGAGNMDQAELQRRIQEYLQKQQAQGGQQPPNPITIPVPAPSPEPAGQAEPGESAGE
jgi:hypothetical protein